MKVKKLTRWKLRLTQFTFKIMHRPGKLNVVADYLSRLNTIESALTLEEIIKMQKEDKNITKSLKYHQINGIYYYYDRIVIPVGLKHVILKYYHDHPIGSHLGFYKTYERIKKNYYWPKMSKDIRIYIKTCESCQKKENYCHETSGNEIYSSSKKTF
jgi:hypothetical protein